MLNFHRTALGLWAGIGLATLSGQAASLQEAAELFNAADTRTLSFSGAGKWYQFGQAPAPQQPWPPFDVSQYRADLDYANASARVQITRIQAIEPGRQRPAPVEQKVDQYVSGGRAWNLAPPPVAAQGAGNLTASPQPAAVEERNAEIWSTPQGFIRAALASKANSRAGAAGLEVSFTVAGKYRYVGIINAKNEVERVQTWIDNPVLGDTLLETRFSDYQTFDGLKFPAHIVREEGGFPVLDLRVSQAVHNPAVEISIPALVASAPPAANSVVATQLAEGVYYLTGGTHHSVAVAFKDHVAVVEAPLNEARSLAVIAKVKELLPGKPIKYLINTHAHFDHAGGLRTFVDEGATIVTHRIDQPYYERAWAAPRTLNPDRLTLSGKPARFETFTDKHVLTDGERKLEIYTLTGNSHNDGLAVVYLPKERLLVEADAYTPGVNNALPSTGPNPYSVNLYGNIEKLGLDVAQIAALHGPRLVTLADLRSAIGVSVANR